MVKIIHAADIHLDSAFAGLIGEKAKERRAGQRTLIRKIVELGNEEHVDIILLAGDLFDGNNAYYETAEALSDALSKSRARIFIAPGNHDPFDLNSPYRAVRFPENVHIFKRESIERVEIAELNCCVYGAGFVTPTLETPLLNEFRAEDDSIKLMVMHGEITKGTSVYHPIREEYIKNSNLDYLGLGHVHSYSGVLRAGNTYYAYPGCPEGRGFDETGDKGILIGTVDHGKVDLQFCKISSFGYTEKIINVENNIMEYIVSQIPDQSKKEVYRIILTGHCDTVNTEEIIQELAPRFYHLSLIDRTKPIRSIWEDEEQDGLKGRFLRRLHAMYHQSEDEQEQARILLAAQFGVAAIDNREDMQ